VNLNQGTPISPYRMKNLENIGGTPLAWRVS
jgi:hypothetical protein